MQNVKKRRTIIERLLLTALLAITASCATDSEKPHTMSTAKAEQSNETGAFFAISVRDLDSMTQWYATMLDMAVVVKADRPPPNGPVALLRNDALLLELQMRSDADDPHSYADGAKEAHKKYGIFKGGVFTPDLNALRNSLKERGAEFNHDIVSTNEPLGLRTFAVRDPEGNTIQFFGD